MNNLTFNDGTWASAITDLENEGDLWREMIANKNSVNTQKAYEIDLRDFFGFYGMELNQVSVQQFLVLERSKAVQLVLKFRRYLMTQRKLKPASMNRKINAIKALAKYAYDVGVCQWKLDVDALKQGKVEVYRDTRGVPPEDIQKILSYPDRSTMLGKRDYAMLQLLWGNGLRRAEVINLNIHDVDLGDRSLWVKGKGNSDTLQIKMNNSTVEAVDEWLISRLSYYSSGDDSLFISLSNINRGKRLCAQTLYNLVNEISKAVNITKKMSPHRVRHSAITTVLERNQGNIRKAQSFSRHADPKTLIIYDDNLNAAQSEMSELLEF
ncbi:MAG: tyrosine-type recombinase/integrase [Trichodesmium sp. St19_bin1]|jgi:integrase/recombinase XerC|nr:tyrosine-type recombinase/integrase [Trichodesmium sp. St19_bin1]